jgi:hypothetical protein
MTNHPNRSKKRPRKGHNPSPEEIINARIKAGLTQPAAAELVYKSTIAWKKCESGENRMPPDTWELFLIKVADLSTPDATAK